jgi:hypothetical protein
MALAVLTRLAPRQYRMAIMPSLDLTIKPFHVATGPIENVLAMQGLTFLRPIPAPPADFIPPGHMLYIARRARGYVAVGQNSGGAFALAGDRNSMETLLRIIAKHDLLHNDDVDLPTPVL